MARELPTPETLRALLSYDANTGLLVWQLRTRDQFASDRSASTWCARYAGKPAGSVSRNGYVVLTTERYGALFAHRVAWAIMTGSWPTAEVDHINGRKTDNRLANLRDVPKAINQQNQRNARSDSATGRLGVSVDVGTAKFVARIRVNGRLKNLGRFASAEAAHAAYIEAKRRLHPGCTI